MLLIYSSIIFFSLISGEPPRYVFSDASGLYPILTDKKNVIERKDYALLIATDQYDEWADLTSPQRDALLIENELETHYGFKTERIINGTTSSIKDALIKYESIEYENNDQLLIFFAGHGYYDEETKKSYLIGRNSKMKDDTRTSYISQDLIRAMIDKIPCNHILLVIDACIPGSNTNPLRPWEDVKVSNAKEAITKEGYINWKLRFKTRRYINSGGKNYGTNHLNNGYSPFSNKLIEAFQTYGGRDSILTYVEIMSIMDSVNPPPISGDFGADEPGSNFLFIIK